MTPLMLINLALQLQDLPLDNLQVIIITVDLLLSIILPQRGLGVSHVSQLPLEPFDLRIFFIQLLFFYKVDVRPQVDLLGLQVLSLLVGLLSDVLRLLF